MSMDRKELIDFTSGKNIILNVGCGNEHLVANSKDNVVVNIDLNDDVQCEWTMDLETEDFPFMDNEVFGIIAKHVVEHIWHRDRFMNEMWRVLKPGGKIYIETPKAGTDSYWKDPTHVSGWIMKTFRYYCDWNTCPANQRKTWQMGYCQEEQRGDDLIIVCELIKPNEDTPEL